MAHRHMPPPDPETLGLKMPRGRLSGDLLPKQKKFRFQLLADFITAEFEPGSRVADVGGGKGFLTYLLCQAGFQATVIDPVDQRLPDKYRDLHSGKRVKLSPEETVPRISSRFSIGIAAGFDLLIGLHAHGSNLMMLDAAVQQKSSLVLLPCCVIGEPEAPPPGQSWFAWLVAQAESRGLRTRYFMLNFKGQNIGFIAEP